MKSKHFGNGDGELDMLFGFFIMNGACIVFFLLFGVCVICNCAARKPKFHGSEEKKKKPTVGRLVAAIAPGGFASKAKAKDSTAEKVEENGGNTPLLFSEKQNSDISNRSNAQRTGRSFKSLVARAIAASRGEVPEGATDVERQQPSATPGTADTASGGRASPPSVATAIAPGAIPDRPSAKQCSPSASRRPSGVSSRRPSGASSRRPSGATCCSITTSVLTSPQLASSSSACSSTPDIVDSNNNGRRPPTAGGDNDGPPPPDVDESIHSRYRTQHQHRTRNNVDGTSNNRTTTMVTFAVPTQKMRGAQAVAERAGEEHRPMNALRSGGIKGKEEEAEEEEVIFL
ncbi:hypothetical protein GPALN_005640 [Globodera pallida]|nr:hypothetical protein GPALN_005640 [Globodera pallida]